MRNKTAFYVVGALLFSKFPFRFDTFDFWFGGVQTRKNKGDIREKSSMNGKIDEFRPALSAHAAPRPYLAARAALPLSAACKPSTVTAPIIHIKAVVVEGLRVTRTACGPYSVSLVGD